MRTVSPHVLLVPFIQLCKPKAVDFEWIPAVFDDFLLSPKSKLHNIFISFVIIKNEMLHNIKIFTAYRLMLGFR